MREVLSYFKNEYPRRTLQHRSRTGQYLPERAAAQEMVDILWESAYEVREIDPGAASLKQRIWYLEALRSAGGDQAESHLEPGNKDAGLDGIILLRFLGQFSPISLLA
jgi:hypothetical protein